MEEQEKKKSIINRALETMSGAIGPLIPLLMAGGFVKITVLLLEQFGVLTPDMGTDIILTFVGDAALYFLPIFVGYSTANQLGASPALGLLVGAMLVHPNFINALAQGPLTFLKMPVYSTSYSSSIFPAFLSVVVMAPIQKFIGEKSPSAIRSITEPFLTILIMIPLALIVIGPLGAILGNYIAIGVMWLYNTLGFVGVAVFSGICPLLVITGMHMGLMPYMIQALASIGWEGIVLPGMIISNVDQGVAALAVAMKTKDEKKKSTALGAAVTAVVGGITEPALYGVNLPLKTPLYGAMIGSTAGGAIAGLLGAKAYVLCGSGGLLGGLPIFLGGGLSSLIAICVGLAAGFVVTFIVTYILYKD